MNSFMSAAGGLKPLPSDVINLFLMAGQSNSDESPVGSFVGLMADLGISNPAYVEAPFTGSPFREWYTSAGFQRYSTDGITNPEATIAVTSLTRSGTTGILQTAAGALAQWNNTSKIKIANANEAGWNDIFRISNKVNDQEIRFVCDESLPASATGSITVRRAGFREVFADYVAKLTADGSYVNVIGMGFMQGEGNFAANSAEWLQGRSFALETYNWIRSTLSLQPRCTIARDFTLVIGLTAVRTTTVTSSDKYVPAEATATRKYQKAACDRRDWAYWVDTIDLPRNDGDVHITDMAAFHTRVLTAAINRRNISGAQL